MVDFWVSVPIRQILILLDGSQPDLQSQSIIIWRAVKETKKATILYIWALT